MTLPHQQRRGFGAFLIDFSYLLTRKEGRRGTPEKPLSDLGLAAYVRYWCQIVADSLLDTEEKGGISLDAICDRTGMTVNDVLGALEHMGLLYGHSQTGGLEIVLTEAFVEAIESKRRDGPRPRSLLLAADESNLHWVPYKCSR